jgi:3alpha(or 20beta)-hydroxysteroid dehydrogenase
MGVLSGKVAIITGAARGQGEAEAALFLAEGCRVVATDMDEATLLAQPRREGLVPLRHDVASTEDWERVVAAALSRFQRLDILVNNAATFVPKTFQQTERADLDHHYAVNQVGVFLGMKAVVAPMIAAGTGSIVNISSVAGLRGSTGAFAYATTKWAVRGMTRSAALELAESGIRVNAILPGLIDTAMMRLNSPERNAALIAAIPLGRPGQVGDIAAAALYLASEAAAYLTGAEIVIDGGQSA